MKTEYPHDTGNQKLNTRYCTHIPDRLLESIMFCKKPMYTIRLALILSRLLHGFHLSKLTILNCELKCFGINETDLSLAISDINQVGWYDIEFIKGKNGCIRVAIPRPAKAYRDSVNLVNHETILDIGIRNRNEENV